MPGVSSGRTNSLSLNMKSNVSSGSGTYAAPVWREISRVSDVNRTQSRATSEVNIRAFDQTLIVLGNTSISITATYFKVAGVTNDEIFNAIEKAFDEGLTIDLLMAEVGIDPAGTGGAPAGSVLAYRGPFVVSQLDKSEPIGEAETYSLTFSITDATQDDGVTPFKWGRFAITNP